VRFLFAAAVAVIAWLLSLPQPGPRVVELPPGVVELHGEWAVYNGIELRGAASGTVLQAASDFQGRALLVVYGAGVTLRGFTLDGNRDELEQRTGLPAANRSFSRFTRGNGILAVGVSRLRVENLRFRDIPGFAVLVSQSRDVRIDRVDVEDSGSHNTRGRNNATGGILLEDGTCDFRVTRSAFRNVRGNGVWTRSVTGGARNTGGWIAFNRFENMGRNAIQVGNAANLRVEDNQGMRIGYPEELVDVEGEGYPMAIDTAGPVSGISYLRNRFTEINGIHHAQK